VVGSNAHKLTVYNLTTRKQQKIGAHSHNVPCVNFSPCGRFIASTSIDKTVKIWEESENGVFKLAKVAFPSADWGWAVQWMNKN